MIIPRKSSCWHRPEEICSSSRLTSRISARRSPNCGMLARNCHPKKLSQIEWAFVTWGSMHIQFNLISFWLRWITREVRREQFQTHVHASITLVHDCRLSYHGGLDHTLTAKIKYASLWMVDGKVSDLDDLPKLQRRLLTKQSFDIVDTTSWTPQNKHARAVNLETSPI